MISKPNGYWNIKEHCLDEAKKYTTRVGLKKGNNTVYKKLTERGWLQEAFENIPMQLKSVGYWTKERCRDEALKYNTRNEFIKSSNSAYVKASNEKWLSEICEHMYRIGNKYNRCVYVYEFSDKSAYVGLTYNIEQRQNDRNNNKNDQVTKYKIKTGLEPIRKLLTDYINANEAAEFEIYYINKYYEDGWNILNVAHGGGLGGGEPKFTYEKSKNKILEYEFLNDFIKNNQNMYYSIKRKQWLELLELIPKKDIIQIKKEIALRNKIKSNPNYLNIDWKYIDNILNIASNFFNVNVFKEQYPIEYKYLVDNKKYSDLLKTINYRRDTITIKEINEITINYKSFKEIFKKDRLLYNLIKYRKIESEVLQHTDHYKYNGEPKWTKERCVEAAIGCNNRREYAKKFPGAYWMAKKEGWIDEILPRVNKLSSHYTKELCYEHSKNFKSRKQFYINDVNYYSYSRKNGWLDDFFPLKTRK